MTIHQVDRADFEREPMADDQRINIKPVRVTCPCCQGYNAPTAAPCTLCTGFGWVSPSFADRYKRNPERILKACANVDKQLQRAGKA